MAIKFEDSKEGDKAPKKPRDGKATTEARFATPIGTSDPVNPDPASELPFGKPPRPEKRAKRR